MKFRYINKERILVLALALSLITVTVVSQPSVFMPGLVLPNSYTLYIEGGNYYAKNQYGQIDYSGSNGSDVLQSVSDLCDNGDSIFFKNGAYNLDTTVTFAKSVNLIGENMRWTYLNALGDMTLIKYSETAESVTIQRLYFRSENKGILLDFRKTVKYLEINHCKFHIENGTCISARRYDGGTISFENFITDSSINVGVGFPLDIQSSELFISNNKFGAGGFGTVTDPSGVLSLYYCPHLTIVGCGFERVGIHLQYSYYTISDSWWSTAIDYAIYVDNGHSAEYQSEIVNNRIYNLISDTTAYGIRLNSPSIDVKHVKIANNIIRCVNSSSYGIRFVDYSHNIHNCSVINNDLTEVAGTKIDVDLTENEVRGNLGYPTENSGKETNCSDGTWVEHGLVLTPTFYSLTSSLHADTWVQAENSTHFQIGVDSGTPTVYWYVEYDP